MSNALAADTMLEEYQIHSVLGTGGFGITYKAWDANLESWVAIKEYFPTEWSYRDHDGVTVRANTQGMQSVADPGLADYEWGLDRFLDEARVLARVKSPFVVRINRYFRANGSAYIVMDYEDGEPLSALLRRRGNLDEADLRGMLKEVLPALQAVHEQGFLHRDIKPGNLYVRADGCVILIDFGAARQSLGRQSKSVTGLVTPGYSPPEQYALRSDRYGTWTDIYALGAVLYRCISGEPPVESAERLIEDSLVPAMEVGFGRYSEALLRVIDKALAVRPEHRYQSVEAMQADLGDLFSEAVAQDGSPSKPAPVSIPTVATVAKPVESPEAQTQAASTRVQEPQEPTSVTLSTRQQRSPGIRPVPLTLALLGALAIISIVIGWHMLDSATPVTSTSGEIETKLTSESDPEVSTSTAVAPDQSPSGLEQAMRNFLQYRHRFEETFREQNEYEWYAVLAMANPNGIGVPANVEAGDERQQIEAYLRLAAERLSTNNLTIPADDSAEYYYQQVMQLSPGDPRAQQGLADIVERYVDLTEAALRRGEKANARRLSDSGLSLDPGHPRLLSLRQQARQQLRRSTEQRPASVRIQRPSPFQRQQPAITQDDLLNRDSR